MRSISPELEQQLQSGEKDSPVESLLITIVNSSKSISLSSLSYLKLNIHGHIRALRRIVVRKVVFALRRLQKHSEEHVEEYGVPDELGEVLLSLSRAWPDRPAVRTRLTPYLARCDSPHTETRPLLRKGLRCVLWPNETTDVIPEEVVHTRYHLSIGHLLLPVQ